MLIICGLGKAAFVTILLGAIFCGIASLMLSISTMFYNPGEELTQEELDELKQLLDEAWAKLET